MIRYTCCFTGHGTDTAGDLSESEIYNKILNAVYNAIEDGYTIFICSGNRGYDLLFAEAVNTAKLDHADIRLEFVLPYRNQSENWERNERSRYSELLDSADSVICLSDKFTPTCIQRCKRVLVARSSLFITVWNGSEGITSYTYGYAKKQHLRIVDLVERHPEETDQLSFL